MSVVYDRKFITHTTEIEFIKAFIAEMKSLNTGIDCSNDPDEEYTKGNPTFVFTMNNKQIFSMVRHDGISFGTDSFDITALVPGYVSTSSRIIFSPSGGATGAVMDRTWYLSYIVSNGLLLITIASSTNKSNNVTSVYISSKNNEYGAAYQVGEGYQDKEMFDLSERTFYNQSSGVSGTFLSRFTYKEVPGKIDYVKSSVYMSSNNKVFEIGSLYDCTDVTFGSTVSLQDGAYFAVGTNQLVKA